MTAVWPIFPVKCKMGTGAAAARSTDAEPLASNDCAGILEKPRWPISVTLGYKKNTFVQIDGPFGLARHR
jgi:hypothetical protein